MVFTLDGDTEIGAHVGSNLCDLICVRHLIGSWAAKSCIVSPERPIFLPAGAICYELPSNISTMGKGAT